MIQKKKKDPHGGIALSTKCIVFVVCPALCSVFRQGLTKQSLEQGWANFLTGRSQWFLKWYRGGQQQVECIEMYTMGSAEKVIYCQIKHDPRRNFNKMCV